ncbi:MAG: methylated-DNA--[protein]-cysteine S-methyltransferase [Parcubacteria bacterium C7867-007]|nr:MAG: methylated-DNA--[protein]-cysteine S-methyltransferase [Parcubacteria bacterium C7867-007]
MKNVPKSNFQSTVYSVVASIPRGSVATYGQIAELAGRPGAARAVGTCMRNNKDTHTVPCHRVVASNGTLAGYAYGDGLSTKKKLLQKEGVSFKTNGTTVDLKANQWQPKRSR